MFETESSKDRDQRLQRLARASQEGGPCASLLRKHFQLRAGSLITENMLRFAGFWALLRLMHRAVCPLVFWVCKIPLGSEKCVIL